MNSNRYNIPSMQIEMQVSGLTIDPVNNAPIVVLREKDGGRILPIWIGVIEASSIAFELEQVKLARPMTHDLLRITIESLGGKVERVAVVDLRDNTYYALVSISRDGQTIEIDARPSDAIALALRSKAPILCATKVLEEAHIRQEQLEKAEETTEKEGETPDTGPKPILDAGERSWKEILENLSPEDFGKYKM